MIGSVLLNLLGLLLTGNPAELPVSDRVMLRHSKHESGTNTLLRAAGHSKHEFSLYESLFENLRVTNSDRVMLRHSKHESGTNALLRAAGHSKHEFSLYESLFENLRVINSGHVMLRHSKHESGTHVLSRRAAPDTLPYTLVWDSPSENAAGSMPCGGGDIGLNVWSEKGDILFYMSRSGTFDENNVFPKLGRVRLRLFPNPFENGEVFRQELKLGEGYVELTGKKGTHNAVVKIWVDVFSPVVHLEVESNRNIHASAWYETWRTEDKELRGGEKFASSFKWLKMPVYERKDDITARHNSIIFRHRNRDTTVFDLAVRDQGLAAVRNQLWNPLKHLTYGGMMQGRGMIYEPAAAPSDTGNYAGTAFKGYKLRSKKAARKQELRIYFHTEQTETPETWLAGLHAVVEKDKTTGQNVRQRTRDWWREFWQQSYIYIRPDAPDTSSGAWQTGRNYQLFRYMLACNAYGSYPTKFNGGLFTYDPVWVSGKHPFSPDFRNWGGGTFTAQNQRLVYWPMLKSGDFGMMPPQFEFYRNALANAELRTRTYWGHKGASFTEQMDQFGLPNYAEYGQKRPAGFDPGVEYNAWLEYQWDTSLEFCLMILDWELYTGKDISRYLPLIESCLVFFDEHYQYRAALRGAKKLDGNGHLVLYPGTALETYKMAYNAAPTIAGLKTVAERLLRLPAGYGTTEQRALWKGILSRVPPLPFREMQGRRTLAPAVAWERINNTEIPQLYPVFPYGIYGIGRSDLDVATATWKYDTEAVKHRNHISWHQDNIFCARLGLTEEAAEITVKKLKNSGRRFPAFWGPGHDWVPDHNWGGSGMIGLQEMLLQAVDDSIYLFPAWPADWDVRFKLHAPRSTVVEGELRNGKITNLVVWPESRRKDLVLRLPVTIEKIQR